LKKQVRATHYKVICLWELDAQPIVKNRILSLYTLLPAMRGANPDLLKHALQKIVQSYSRQQVGSQILWCHRMMCRSQTMSYQEKLEIEEALHMQYQFDEFILVVRSWRNTSSWHGSNERN
jgi:hypothetical protein